MPVEVNILVDVTKALAELNTIARDFPKFITNAHKRIAKLAHRESVRNAPIGPSQAQHDALRKTTRKTTRNARATSRRAPGGLERSLQFEGVPNHAAIFIPSNSEAGRYAVYIHDLKGTAWRNRGAGTQAKGTRADAKFIARAVIASEADMLKIIESETDKALQARFAGRTT